MTKSYNMITDMKNEMINCILHGETKGEARLHFVKYDDDDPNVNAMFDFCYELSIKIVKNYTEEQVKEWYKGIYDPNCNGEDYHYDEKKFDIFYINLKLRHEDEPSDDMIRTIKALLALAGRADVMY